MSRVKEVFWLCYGEYRGDRTRITPFLHYVAARQKVADEEKAYRIYVTDSLKAAYNLNARYVDFLGPQKPEDTRTPEEIINDISAKLEALNNK